MAEECLKERIAGYQRTYVEVDLDAIIENMCNLKRKVSEHTQMIGVIKTDGYGHGCVPIAHSLEPLDFMYGFAVATAEEAHILRLAGVKKPIMMLGYAFPDSYEMLVREEIRPALFRGDTLEELVEAARRVGKPVKVHVKVDTGMGRIGITPDEEGLAFVKKLMEYQEIEIEGIFTHFARADEMDKTTAYKQLNCFQNFITMLEERLGLQIPVKHCSNSAGIIELPEANMDVVRAGISLYGLRPSEEVSEASVSLRPALSWYSTIVYCKTIHKGQSVSYGGCFTAEKDTRVATIPVGYGDGYPRALSGKGYVLIHGRKAPILGRVCMDQFMVDVTEIPGAQEGDRVTLIGTDEAERISAELLGAISGRFNYELVCDISKRVPRVYVQSGEVVSAKDYHNDCE
ncbi:MAG: alanine racemase [Lachnospiraceae bacterium]|nr:alanine racemase [Lachnospiraceae bacterium]